MLTNELPNRGNGTFLITAVATDSSGNNVTLGTKRVTCDNANALQPFGSIDSPTLGGDASGANFIHFGWALTSRPNTIPEDGSTIIVWVDGIPLEGNPVYNNYRQDIATLFPGYNNSSGAVGFYMLDTTAYKNGMHTISWSVSDNAGNSSGIGSRYFRIVNIGHQRTGAISAAGLLYRHQLLNKSIRKLEVSYSPVYLVKGYKYSRKNEELKQKLFPDKKGEVNIKIGEGEPVTVELKDSRMHGELCDGYVGFLIFREKIKPLPIGSSLDERKDIFSWQPGPGFIGEYRFVFIEKKQDGRKRRRIINITINPKH